MTPTQTPATPTTPAALEQIINTPITPFPVVQQLLDQTADFHFYAEPRPTTGQRTITPGNPADFFGINGGYGIRVECLLRGFDARLDPGGRPPVSRAGAPVGKLAGTIYFAPDDSPYDPASLPAPAIHDPWRSKKLILTGAKCSFGHGDSIELYGVGRTFPVFSQGGTRLLMGAVADVRGGTGRFQGLEGTMAMNGWITPALDFEGSITLRLPDYRGALRDSPVWPSLQAPRTLPGAAFITLRGDKERPTIRTTVGAPKGSQQQLITPSIMRPLETVCAGSEQRPIASAQRQGPVVCRMDATVGFDLTAPRPASWSSVPFTTEEVYRFRDARGAETGTIECGVVEGISFNLRFPGRPQQPGVRFAGCGPVTGGTGCFAGARGMLTVNSLIGISPHALSLIHVLHLVDPPRAWQCTERRA